MKMLRFLSVLLLLCSLPFCAFAANSGLLESTAEWLHRDEVVHNLLNVESPGGRLDGVYSYYSDLQNNCFYLHLSYNESSLMDDSNEIYLNFNIKNSSREYQFCVDENTDKNVIDNTFNVQCNFGEIWGGGQEIYIGIEFLNKDDKKLNNTVSFFLSVNNHEYYICKEDISLNYGDYAESSTAKPTTTKQTTTKQPTTKKETTTKEMTTKTTTTKPATTEKTTKETTTKKTITKEPTTKKETTTKFRYTGDGSEYFTIKQTTVNQETEEKTTAKRVTETTAEKTTKEPTATTEKSAKETTTKFSYTGAVATNSSEKSTQNTTNSTTSKQQSNNSERQSNTTKFHYIPEESTTVPATQFDTDPIEADQIENVQNEYIPPEDFPAEDYQNENIFIIPETQHAESMSPQSKLLIALAVVFAVSGTALIMSSLSKKEKDNEEQKEEQ